MLTVEKKLHDYDRIKWFTKDEMTIKGWCYINGKELRDSAFVNNMTYQNETSFEQWLMNANGNFSIVWETDDSCYIAVDHIQSFPMFFAIYENKITISDRLDTFKNIIDEKGTWEIELLSAGFEFGRNTPLKNVVRLRSGEYVRISKYTGDITYKTFYLHTHSKAKNTIKSKKMLLKELDKAVLNSFDRLVNSAAGRPIVVLLSGGYDSRLVVTSLKRLNYKNVICVSFGTEADKDFVVAREVAASVGYQFIHVLVDKKYWKEKETQGEIDRILSISDGIGMLSHFHLGSIIKDLIDNEVITHNSIIVTGQSGDAIEGDHIHGNFCGRTVTVDDIADVIMSTHCYLRGRKYITNKEIKEIIIDNIREYVEYYGKELFSEDEAEDIIEIFDWRERQSKYVVSDSRNYDEYAGVEWRLPLWDIEFVKFWETVPYEYYKHRYLYYNYVEKDNLPTANNQSVGRRLINIMKKMIMPVFNMLYLPKALYDYWFSNQRFFATLGGVSFKYLIKTLHATKGYRNTPTSYYVEIFYERFLRRRQTNHSNEMFEENENVEGAK